jgi:DnaJ-class molecular chaperone
MSSLRERLGASFDPLAGSRLLPEPHPCVNCGGTGYVWRLAYDDAIRPAPCYVCGGTGTLTVPAS